MSSQKHDGAARTSRQLLATVSLLPWEVHMRAIFAAIRTAIIGSLRLAWTVLSCWIPGWSPPTLDMSADNDIQAGLDEVRARAVEASHPSETLYGMAGLGERIVAYCRSNDPDLVDISGIEPHIVAALISLDDSQRRRLAVAGPKRATQWSMGEPAGLPGLPRLYRRQGQLDPPGHRRVAAPVRNEPALTYVPAYA